MTQASTMSQLDTGPHLERPDDFYEALIEAHQGLSNEQSQALNARLVLLLANHIGSFDVLQEALTLARSNTLHREVAP
jgi:hypothetical protein